MDGLKEQANMDCSDSSFKKIENFGHARLMTVYTFSTDVKILSSARQTFSKLRLDGSTRTIKTFNSIQTYNQQLCFAVCSM
jgi:hypothetical protein